MEGISLNQESHFYYFDVDGVGLAIVAIRGVPGAYKVFVSFEEEDERIEILVDRAFVPCEASARGQIEDILEARQ